MIMTMTVMITTMMIMTMSNRFRRKLTAKLQEMQEHLDAANQRVSVAEKAKLRVAQELEDAQVDADRV